MRKSRERCGEISAAWRPERLRILLTGSGGTPSQIVSARELLRQCQERLSAEERSLADRRRSGQGWEEIAAAVGRSADAVRKQYERAIKCVSGDLGIEELSHG